MKLASSKECTCCMACIDICPHSILKSVVDKNGYYIITTDPNVEKQCVECGRCSRVCPVLNKTQKSRVSVPYAAWNTSSIQRRFSASGGIFAALATSVIHKGGSVYGAVIEGFDIKHQRITDEHDLYRLQGSKYQHSNMVGIYKQVREDLRNGKYVLFSGMGCQVEGLLLFLGKMNKEHLYTIDTICGGLSTMLPMIHLKNSGKYKGICSFRDKNNGWQSRGFKYSLKMVCKNGAIEDLGLDNMVLNTFSSKLLKRSSCLDCKFTGINRQSDCTIGDFWGDISFKEQHREGLSVFVAHNERIMSLVKDSTMEVRPISWNSIIVYNHNIVWTHYPLIRYFYSRYKVLRALQNQDYLLVANVINPWSISGLLLRVYLKINSLHRIIFELFKKF